MHIKKVFFNSNSAKYSAVFFCCVQLLSHVLLFVNPWTVAHQTPYPWNFSGKNTGVGCHFLLQEIFPTQGLNLCLLHCRQILYHLSHPGSVIIDALNLNDSVHILLTTLNPMAIPNLKELGNSNPTMCLEK